MLFAMIVSSLGAPVPSSTPGASIALVVLLTEAAQHEDSPASGEGSGISLDPPALGTGLWALGSSPTQAKTSSLARFPTKCCGKLWLDSITNSMDTNLSKLWEIVKDRGVWSAVVHGVTKS